LFFYPFFPSITAAGQDSCADEFNCVQYNLTDNTSAPAAENFCSFSFGPWLPFLFLFIMWPLAK
jgi:hypothetical protein